jgi:hypothetical protein
MGSNLAADSHYLARKRGTDATTLVLDFSSLVLAEAVPSHVSIDVVAPILNGGNKQ